jgi:hypothetical protein
MTHFFKPSGMPDGLGLETQLCCIRPCASISDLIASFDPGRRYQPHLVEAKLPSIETHALAPLQPRLLDEIRR